MLLPSFSLLSRGLPRRQSRLTVLTTSSHLPTFYVSKNFKLTLQETKDIYLCPPFLPLSMDVPVPSAGSQSSAVTNTHTCQHCIMPSHVFAKRYFLYQRNNPLGYSVSISLQLIKQNAIKHGTSTFQNVRSQKMITGALGSHIYTFPQSLCFP